MSVSIVVTVVIIGAIISLSVGVVTSLISILSAGAERNRIRPPIMMSTGPTYWNYAVWSVGLGIILLLAPASWYGPSWYYFSFILPHNGFGMGICCTILGGLLMLALRREASAGTISILLFLNGFVYWTAGIILGAEGLLGHQGLMEAPFMMVVGGHAFAHSAALRVYSRREKTQ